MLQLILLLGLLPGGAPLFAQPSQFPATAEEALAQTRAKIAAQLQDKGEVSLIVGLDLPAQTVARPDSAAGRARQASIRSAQGCFAE